MRGKDKLYEPVNQNEQYGFFELGNMYRKSMQDFYKDEYYQNDYSVYNHAEYEDIDIEHKNNFYATKQYVLHKFGKMSEEDSSKQFCILDIGAGEGYALAFFHKNGWNVTGIDLSSYGITQHNPQMREYLLQGDFEKVLRQLSDENKQFDFINADYVLEHVPDPEMFFKLVKGVCHNETILCVTVPNDYSTMQLLAYDMGRIDVPFWVTAETSEHFSYFSVDSLSALGEGVGYQTITALADWPIDFFLLHPETNYQNNSSVGHDCHIACTRLENAICKKSIDDAVKLFCSLADAGIGRSISIYFKLK